MSAIQFGRSRFDFLLGELAGHILDHPLLFRQFKIHFAPPPSAETGTLKPANGDSGPRREGGAALPVVPSPASDISQ